MNRFFFLGWHRRKYFAKILPLTWKFKKIDVILLLLSKQKRFIDLPLSRFVIKRTSLVALQKCKIFKFLCCQWLGIWHFANDFASLRFNDLLKFNSVSDCELFDNWCLVVTFENNCRHVFSSKDRLQNWPKSKCNQILRKVVAQVVLWWLTA